MPACQIRSLSQAYLFTCRVLKRDFEIMKSTAEPVRNIRAFVTLDGLRGIAAIAIAIRHAPYLWDKGFPTNILRESYLAVDFFFVLSGFVISYAYSDRFSSGLSATRFMVLRLIRLYPLYLFALAISLTIAFGQLMHGTIDKTTFITGAVFGILFIPSPFSKAELFPLNGLAWSLFFEIIINYAFGLFESRLTRYVLIAVVSIAGLTLTMAVSSRWLGFGIFNGPMDAGQEWRSIFAGLARVTNSFFAGVLMLRLWKANVIKVSLPPAVLVIVLSAVLLSFPSAAYQLSFDLFSTIVVFPVLVVLGACSVPNRTTARLFEWLGGISYGLYIMQIPLYGCIARVLNYVGLSGLFLLLGTVSVVVAVIDNHNRRVFRSPRA